MSNHDPYSDSPSLLVGFGTTKVYSADRSRHCHGINYAQNPLNERNGLVTSLTFHSLRLGDRMSALNRAWTQSLVRLSPRQESPLA